MCCGSPGCWDPCPEPLLVTPLYLSTWSPLPHLAVYCCNLMTSNMLYNRPHSEQGGSLPTHLVGPHGPRCQGEPLCSLPITCFPPLHWGPQAGCWPVHKYIIGEGGWGFAVSLCRTWREDHVLLGTLPRNSGCHQTPVQATAAVSHHRALTSSRVRINSGQTVGVWPSSVVVKLVTDLFSQCAPLMYTDETLLFYDLFIQSLMERKLIN